MDARVAMAIANARALGDDAEWGASLRTELDAAGVSDADRLHAVADKLSEARELLACSPLDDAGAGSHEIACALDSQLDAAHGLALALRDAAEREP